jgi:hypothetical protein
LDIKNESDGAFLVWKWGDNEIENPRVLKNQLEAIRLKEFSGVLATLGASRYEVIDRKVVRAVTQVSQWAKNRSISFWFHPDPRQASRSLITTTGERTQNLIVYNKPDKDSKAKSLNITRVKNNRFVLKYTYPTLYYTPIIQEVSLHFDPAGLERVFLFQMENGIIIRESIKDITNVSRFFANMGKATVEVFGEIHVPEEEEWWVIAFPKFDTNLYDYAGRESNDRLRFFIEELFDAGANLSGIVWDEAGYCGDAGRFPVSLSIYNCFLAEYGYDLRDMLFALVMELDDGFHIRVRCDYYSFLLDTIFSAQNELCSIVHSFFGSIEVGQSYSWPHDKYQSSNYNSEYIDPWRNLKVEEIAIAKIEKIDNIESEFDTIISSLNITKSLGIFSKGQQAFTSILGENLGEEEFIYLTDLMSMFSVRWLVQAYGEQKNFSNSFYKKPIYPENSMWNNFKNVNFRLNAITKITESKFPSANVLLVYPIETIMSNNFKRAEEIIFHIKKLVCRLLTDGVQLDIVSSELLKKARFKSGFLHIQRRIYQSVIFPYPEILSSQVLELVSTMEKYGFPIFIGGSKPQFTSEAKRIPHEFSLSFDPQVENMDIFWDRGVERLFILPKNCLGTFIQKKDEILLLFCPSKFRGIIEGEFQYGNMVFSVPRSTSLVIFRFGEDKKIYQVF